MSGHSHAKKIKRAKEATDQKRGQIFSKMARVISIAAKGGGDPTFNSSLRVELDKAKELNMPTENIERAIKRGTGELAGEKLEEVLFEAYGPAGIAVIIEGITDNKNRTLSEIKQILNQNSGKLVGEGAVKWMFEKKGCIVIDLNGQNEEFKNKENMEMAAIELGAQDFLWRDGMMEIYTKIEDMDKATKNLESRGIKTESSSLDWIAKEDVPAGEKDKEACQKLFDALDENEDIQGVYSNLKD